MDGEVRATQEPRHSKALSWLGSGLLLAGSIAVSLSPKIAAGWKVFAMFALGHLIWVTVSLIRKDSALFSLNGGMVLLDLYAVYIRNPEVLNGSIGS